MAICKNSILVCKECGNEDIWFDAWVDQYGNVVSTFDNTFCPECDGECSTKRKTFDLKEHETL